MSAIDQTNPCRAPIDWEQVVELVEGLKRQNFTPTQTEYFRASLGLCWAKATMTERARWTEGE